MNKILLVLLAMITFCNTAKSQAIHFQGDSTEYRFNYGYYRIELFDNDYYTPYQMIIGNDVIKTNHYFYQSENGESKCRNYIDLKTISNFEDVLRNYKLIREGLPLSKLVFIVDEKQIINLK
jgi:hypothetical protein